MFGTEASLGLSYTVLLENLGISKNKGTFLWKFCSVSGFRTTYPQRPISPSDINKRPCQPIVDITRRQATVDYDRHLFVAVDVQLFI